MTAFSRRQKGSDGKDDKPEDAKVEGAKAETEEKEEKGKARQAEDKTGEGAKAEDKTGEGVTEKSDAKVEAAPEAPVARATPQPEPTPEPVPEPRIELKPPAVTAESPRVRQATLVPFHEQPVGKPPEMPAFRTEKSATGDVEDPTRMPGSKEIPDGNPEDPAAPPGRVPPGDSRSLRRGHEFALVYRQTTFVISRFGTVGQRGQWRVVEYPTSASASHSYAKECSRFVSEGFSDYRA